MRRMAAWGTLTRKGRAGEGWFWASRGRASGAGTILRSARREVSSGESGFIEEEYIALRAGTRPGPYATDRMHAGSADPVRECHDSTGGTRGSGWDYAVDRARGACGDPGAERVGEIDADQSHFSGAVSLAEGGAVVAADPGARPVAPVRAAEPFGTGVERLDADVQPGLLGVRD